MIQEDKFKEAKRLYQTANADQKYILESLFPELKGDEDEKIKEEIKIILANTDHSQFALDYTFADMINWLEKHAQKLCVEDNAKEMFINALERVEEQNNKGYELTNCDKNSWWEDFKTYCGFTELQQNAWSEEDEYYYGIIQYILNNECVGKTDKENAVNWFKSLKDRVQSKQEWSKEGENNILFLTSIIEECFKDKEKITLCGDTVCANFTKEDVIDRLKSLRPQNTCIYNPYKAIVESIAEMCKHYDKASLSGLRDFYDNVKVKCKDAKEYDSLYLKSRWKPSEDLINVLNEVLNYAANHKSPHWNDYIFRILNNLIKQLKELKE